ncbi:MAG: DNA primase [Oscillospiraceae bacterium]|nr:DNA primase [Oscillospiraceae bacterium]
MLPESFIQELKMRVSLEDIAGQYVRLKRAGSNLVGCCPFHSEKTPSFTIYSPGDHFYCFGCGAGGDVITFVMRIEALDYMSAVEQLAERAGMKVPDEGQDAGQRTDKQRYYEINKKAARYFYEILMSPRGEPGMKYLIKRGLGVETIRHFGLGYAGDDFDGLVGYLSREGFTAEEMKTAFLAGIGSKSGKPFDYFRGRVMFPIIDLNGKVCAFGGRIIGDGNPKYLNSSDTPVFKKSRTLFAGNYAKNAGTDSLILCEGYMDVIALHAAGFTNAVATLGTSLTGEQSRLMRRYASKVFLCYDSDEPGKKAAKRAIELLDAADIKVKVITLQGAKDPDEYIKTFGKAAFQEVLDGSEGQIEYTFNSIKAGYDLNVPEDKLRFAREICAKLSGIRSPLEKEVYIERLRELTGLDASILRAEADRSAKRAVRSAVRERTEADLKKTAGYGDTANPEKIKYPAACAKEEGIIGILLLRPEYLADEKTRTLVDPGNFVTAFGREAVTELLKLGSDGGFDFSYLAQSFSPDKLGALTRMKLARASLTDNSPAVLASLAESLKEEKKAAESAEITSAEALAERLKELRKQKS